jgi:hypothetical protein
MISLELILVILFFIVGFIILIVLINKNRSRNIEPFSSDFSLDISVLDETESVKLYLYSTNPVTIDWDDGTIQTYTVTTAPYTEISHIYLSKDNYIIKGNGLDITTLLNVDILSPSVPANKITSFNVIKLKNLNILGILGSLLTSANVSGLTKLEFINFAENTLSTNSINEILNTVDSFNTSNYTLILLNQNPLASPSSGPPDGITAKANLISRGWTVNTD